MSYKVYIRVSPIEDSYELYLVDIVEGKQYVAKPMDLVWIQVHPGEEYIATLKVPARIGVELFKAMKGAITKQGIKTDDENMLKAELKATKYHLQDMRKLVFKK